MIGFWIHMAARARGYDASRASRIAGVRRVLGYAVVVSLILGLGALHRAKADTAEAARGLGRDLLAISDLLSDRQELRLNGEVVHVASSVATTGVKNTLDRFEQHCDADPGALGHDWVTTSAVGATPVDGGHLRLGTFRSGDDEEGAVVCLVGSPDSPRDLATTIEAFSRTQDLGVLGRMRYAYAKKSAGGTHVLAAWTDDHFHFRSLAPEGEGDAPGTDSSIVPRPPGGRRLLSAEVAGTQYAVRVYTTPAKTAEVVAAYEPAMKERGFEAVASADRPGERAYVRGGFVVVMTIQPDDAGSAVSIAELGR